MSDAVQEAPVKKRKAPLQPPPGPSKLKEAVRKMLNETDIPMPVVAYFCNVSVPFLNRLRSEHGAHENPSVDRVERLYEYLSGKELTF